MAEDQEKPDMKSPDMKSGEKHQSDDKHTARTSFNQRLNEFVQKNRKVFFFSFVAIIVILVGFIITLSVRTKLQTSAFVKVDALEQRYEDLQSYIGSDKPEASSKQTDIETLQKDIISFADRNSGYAAARAYYLSAKIYAAEKKWPEAEKTWGFAAKAAKKSYLAPISLYNAAVAAEEQGNIDSAIDLYKQTLNLENGISVAVRAQFSIGRLEESRNNKEAALEAYKNLVGKWPADPFWANLAQDRIMILSN